MTNFLNILLPEFLSPYIIGGPYFDTSIIRTVSGREVRFANLQNACQKYTIKGCHLTPSELNEFNAFFRNAKGAASGFCMKDDSDHTAVEQILYSKTNDPLTYEVSKEYKFGDQKYLRRIFKPIPESIEIKTTDQKEIHAESNYDLGILTLKDPLPEGIGLITNFSFYVPVRFKEDHFNYCNCKDGSIMLEDIELIEVMP